MTGWLGGLLLLTLPVQADGVAGGVEVAAWDSGGDAFGRPEHLRAVQAPPASLADLRRRRLAVRLWWDAAAPAEVQQERGEGWRTVAEAVGPGWTSRPVPPGTRFRVRLGEGRWSEPVAAPTVATPTDIARLTAPDGAMLGERVGRVAAELSTGRVWASTLGGGAVQLDASGTRGAAWTRWEGLPDDRVIDLSLGPGVVVLGTAEGALLIDDDGGTPRPRRVWAEGLPSRWVQSTAVDGDRVWLGTYEGLVLAEDPAGGAGALRTVLEPWSVFSILPDGQGGAWVGYDGLRRVDGEGEEVGAWLPELHVYDIEAAGDGVRVATIESGVFEVGAAGGALAPPDGDEAYSLVTTPAGRWVARGNAGLQTPGQGWIGRGAGLPSETVWAVADAGAGVWAGTSRGLARVLPGVAGGPGVRVATVPMARWPADRAVDLLLPMGRGLWLAGPSGMTGLGRPHRASDDLVVAAPLPLVALLDDKAGGAWAIGNRAVHLDRRGDLSGVTLPGRPTAAAVYDGGLWLAIDDQLWRLADGAERAAPVLSLPSVTRMVAGTEALWAVAGRRVVRVQPGTPRPFLQTHPVLDLAPDPVDPDRVWVGSQDGLERLTTRGPDEGAVEDVLGDDDRGVLVPAVAADGHGGCWFAAADGTVGRVLADGTRRWLVLPGQDPPWPEGIVVDDDGRAAWVLTDGGPWYVRLP